jgi:hypothetical protein
VYSWDSGSRSFPFQAAPANGWTAAQQKADVCAGTVDAIGVWVQFRTNFLTNLFGNGGLHDHVTVMRLEPAGSDLCS